MSFDQKWQITLLHQVLQDTGKITNKDAAEKLVQTLAGISMCFISDLCIFLTIRVNQHLLNQVLIIIVIDL